MAKKVTQNREQAKKKEAQNRTIRLIVGILLILAAAGIVIGGVLFFQKEQKQNAELPDASDYEKVLSSYYSAIISSDGKTMSQIMAPPEYWTYYMETYDKTENDVIYDFAEGCNRTLEEWQTEYGADVKVSYQIAGLSQQGQEGLDEWNADMEQIMGNSGASLSEAVTLEVHLSFQGNVKSGSDIVYPTLGKIGENWYIISEDDESLQGEVSGESF